MKLLLYISLILFIACFDFSTSQTIYTCTDCNCSSKTPCVDRPNERFLCYTNNSYIDCSDYTVFECDLGCGPDRTGIEKCLCPNNCSGNGDCSSGSCNCDAGYFGESCDQTDFCFDKESNYLYCDPYDSGYMIACVDKRIDPDQLYPCSNCTADVNGRGYCNCPNNCSGNGECSQANLNRLGQCSCSGNFIGLDCSEEYTSCPQLYAERCSGSVLVVCNGLNNVESSTPCPNGCTSDGSTALCTCLAGCGPNGNCVDGICQCTGGYIGETCSETTICTGHAYGYVCINSTTTVYCYNYQPDYRDIHACPGGCNTVSNMGCYCNTTNCINGGCSLGICLCDSGWEGDRCDIPISGTPGTPGTPNTPLPVTTGFCARKMDGYYCDGDLLSYCISGIISTATQCQYGCNSTLWGGSHTCQTLKCPLGYFGDNCEFSDPCLNGTNAALGGGTQDYCVGNMVVRCDNTDQVSRTFCVNGCTGSVSVVTGRSSALCNCQCGPQGISCDTVGNCICADGWRSCPPGFSGDDCQTKTNACSGLTGLTICQTGTSTLLNCFNGEISSQITCSLDCKDNATCACTNDCSGNGFCASNGVCVCRVGYGGDDCSEALDCTGQANGFRCDSSGQNLVTCMRDRMLANVTCPGGCTDGVCRCASDCNGQGTCRNGVCRCNTGYTGEACEFYLDSDITTIFIVLIGVGLGIGVAYVLIIYYKTKVAVPEIELEELRAKNPRKNAGRLHISKRANTQLKLSRPQN